MTKRGLPTSAEDKAKIIALIRDGAALHVIARETGFSSATVSKIARRHGLQLDGRKSPLSESERAFVRARIKAGAGIAEIARHLGRPPSTISHYVERRCSSFVTRHRARMSLTISDLRPVEHEALQRSAARRGISIETWAKALVLGALLRLSATKCAARYDAFLVDFYSERMSGANGREMARRAFNLDDEQEAIAEQAEGINGAA